MKILFVCRGNVGRSQIAEALFSKIAPQHEVLSAGTKLSGPEQPLGELRPGTDIVIDAMKEIGMDISNYRRKEVTKKMADDADKIVMVVDERDPVPDYLLNNPKVIIWDVLDPKGRTLEFTINTRKQIEGLLNEFVKSL